MTPHRLVGLDDKIRRPRSLQHQEIGPLLPAAIGGNVHAGAGAVDESEEVIRDFNAITTDFKMVRQILYQLLKVANLHAGIVTHAPGSGKSLARYYISLLEPVYIPSHF